jgi:hypothetical protein
LTLLQEKGRVYVKGKRNFIVNLWRFVMY